MNTDPSSTTTIPAFSFMTKPRGAICNLDCKYCYFLSKEIDRPMKIMAGLIRQQRAPAGIMALLKAEDEARLQQTYAAAGRNDPCPCGSGKKFKQCHGRTARFST
jgi:uncharacterized protein